MGRRPERADRAGAIRPRGTTAFQASTGAARMSRGTRLIFLASLVILTDLLAGCAVYSVYRKCGYHGCPGDAKITAEVHALLNQHPELGPPNQVYVHTLDQVVYLSGQVATELQRDTADSLARQAAGARQVNDIMGVEYNGR